MANDAFIIATGNLTADPEEKKTTTGQPYISFDIAVQTTMKKEDGSGYASNFYRVQIFKEHNEWLLDRIQKGTSVEVRGELTLQNYVSKKTGQPGSSLNIKAFSVVPRMRLKTSKPKDDDEFPL